MKPKKVRLELSDLMCPICLSILTEPVTLPCKHELCLSCFKQNVDEGDLKCPVCRTRISTWARKAVRENGLINKKRWTQIKRAFPEKVRNRLNGVEDEVSLITVSASTSSLSEPGEIRKEYELQLKLFQEEQREAQERDTKANEEFIRKLLDTDRQMVEDLRRERELIAAKDEIIVRQIANRIAKFPQVDDAETVDSMLKEVNTSLADTFLRLEPTAELLQNQDVVPASTSSSTISFAHGNSELRSTSVESNDSITSEMCHFKPIIAAPKTPPKKLPDGQTVEPSLVQIKARKLDFSSCESPVSQVFTGKFKSLMGRFVVNGEIGVASTPGAGTRQIKYAYKKGRGIKFSYKENYPFYTEKSPIPTSKLRKRTSYTETEDTSSSKRKMPVPKCKRCIGCCTQSIKPKQNTAAKTRPRTRADSDASSSGGQPKPNQTSDDCKANLCSTYVSSQELEDRELALKIHNELNKFNKMNDYHLRSRHHEER